MSIFDRIKNIANGNIIMSAREAFKIGWSLPPRRTTDLWTDIYHKSPMLDPVDMIASDFAAVPYKIFQKNAYRKDPKNTEPYGDHPIYDILDHPMTDHPEIDFYQLMYLTDMYYEIIGDTFWLIDRDGRNKPAGVYIVPPTWMLLTPTMNIPWFRIQPMGNTSHRYFNADPADIVWFKAPDATNPYGRGRARAEAIGDEIETHEFSAQYAKRFFYNDAVSPLILEMPGISDDMAERFKESWQQKLGGFLNARKIGVVNKKDFKVHQLSSTPKEMDFVESRRYLIEQANEHFSSPPEMRGHVENSNRSTIDSAIYFWTRNVISKRTRTFASCLNNQFVPMFDKNGYWKFDEIVPEDKEFKLKVLQQGWDSGTITRDEWRLGNEFPGDDLRGNVYKMPTMSQEVPAFKEPIAEEPKPSTIGEGTADQELNDDNPAIEGGKSVKFQRISLDDVLKELTIATDRLPVKVLTNGSQLTAILPKPKTIKSSLNEEAKTAIWKSFDKHAISTEGKFKDSVSKIVKYQRGKVKNALTTALNKEQTSDAIDKALADVFVPEFDIKAKLDLKPAWLNSMGTGRAHALLTLANGKSYKAQSNDDITNPWFIKWIEKNGLSKAKQINDTTHELLRTNLQATLAESIASGDGLRARMKSLMEATDGVYDDMDSTRAEKIARTESTSTVNYGTYATYKVEGVEKKEWLSVRDDRTRGQKKGDEFDHFDADGEIVGIDEPFVNTGEELDFPGDPAGSAGNIIQCRCTLAPVFEEAS